MKRKSLLLNISILVTAVLAALIIFTGFGLRFVRNAMYRETRETLEETLKLVINTVPDDLFEDPAAADAAAGSIARESKIRLTFILPDGTVIGDSERDPELMDYHGDRPEIAEALTGSVGSSLRHSATIGIDFLYIAFPFHQNDSGELDGVFRAAMPVSAIRSTVNALLLDFAVTSAVIFIVVFVFGAVSLKHLRNSTRAINEAARHFSEGRLDYTLKIDRPAEMRPLAATFNEMSRRLGDRIRTIVRQKDELEAVLSSMVEAVIVLDSNIVIRKINKSGLTLANRPAGEVQERSLIEVFRNTELYDFANSVLSEESPQETAFSIYSPSGPTGDDPSPAKGKKRYLQVHGTSIELNGPAEKGVLLVLNDITRLKHLENMRKDFVANVSHELKTPITSIQGFVETLAGGTVRDEEKTARFLGIIEKQTSRLNSIIDDLLSLSRLEQSDSNELEMQPFSLKSILLRAVQICFDRADKKNITIESENIEEAQARVNPQLIEQAVINLIDNAIKYSEHNSRVQVGLCRENGTVRISVEDNGCGIPENSISRVFERFYRVDKARSRDLGGTGLGLAIVKHIALAHGGEATAASEFGRGSVFTILLPGI